MKVGDIVKNDYHGIERYGVIIDINMKDNWFFLNIDWVYDNQYKEAIAWRKKLTNTDYSLSEYRLDQVKKVDVEKTIKTLEKCRLAAKTLE